MGRPTRIVIPLFQHEIYVYYSLDEYTGDDYPKGSSAVTWDVVAGVHSTTIVFKHWSIANAAHEATHAVCAMLKHVGVPITYDNQESLAYPIGYLVEEIIKGKEKWDVKRSAK